MDILSKRAERASERLFSTPRQDAEILDRIGRGKASIYRFLGQEEHADGLCAGRILISTLGSCRAYENERRGDRDEGALTYTINSHGGSDDRDFVEMAARAGILVDGARNITLVGTHTEVYPDAYVLCTTVRYSPRHMVNDYGNFCVEITDAIEFGILIDRALNRAAKEASVAIHAGMRGLVTYADRTFSGLSAPPGVMGFVKPADKHAEDREYRFLWPTVGKQKIDKIVLEVPGLARFCRRIR